jgi:hypothetical protein
MIFSASRTFQKISLLKDSVGDCEKQKKVPKKATENAREILYITDLAKRSAGFGMLIFQPGTGLYFGLLFSFYYVSQHIF